MLTVLCISFGSAGACQMYKHATLKREQSSRTRNQQFYVITTIVKDTFQSAFALFLWSVLEITSRPLKNSPWIWSQLPPVISKNDIKILAILN